MRDPIPNPVGWVGSHLSDPIPLGCRKSVGLGWDGGLGSWDHWDRLSLPVVHREYNNTKFNPDRECTSYIECTLPLNGAHCKCSLFILAVDTPQIVSTLPRTICNKICARQGRKQGGGDCMQRRGGCGRMREEWVNLQHGQRVSRGYMCGTHSMLADSAPTRQIANGLEPRTNAAWNAAGHGPASGCSGCGVLLLCTRPMSEGEDEDEAMATKGGGSGTAQRSSARGKT
ncbi:hypothetical protein B0H17DRAFT_1147093 [Mycena rosella]|uniref:Uncharacterized protein n=1 Tax=Mycena rosella TaxID=1033263 RepID=A0AAD7CMJ9_MYCRO|nr:hypothetical protein B0H17DRAFT_1147093 [Mycena rosella]